MGMTGSSNTPGNSSVPCAIDSAALPPAWLASNSTVAPLRPGEPACGRGAAGAAPPGLAAVGGAGGFRRGRRLRGDAQAADPPLGLVALRGAQRALPVQVDALDQPARRIGIEHAVRRIAERQPVGNEGQRGQVEPVGAQGALLRRAAARGRVLQPQVAAGPAHAVGGVELQGGGRELELFLVQLAGQPPGHCAQHQRLQAPAQRGVDAVEPEVGRAAHDLAPLHVGPQAQRAAAFADAGVEGDIAAQARDVHVGQVGIDLAVPGLPAARAHRQQRLAELPAQREALAPADRRRGVEPEAVAPGRVARHEAHVGQQQGLGLALLVGPAHGAALDHQLALGEKPVGGAGLSGGVGVHVQARHVQLAEHVAAHVELRPFDVELLEIEAPQRARRHAGHHPHEAQGFPLLGVVQHHVAQFEGGKETIGTRRDRPDAHGYPDGLAGLCLERATVIADSRHNPRV